MKLTYLDCDDEVSECTVAEAIQCEHDARLSGTGVLENLADNMSFISRTLGVLIQHLLEKGILDKDVVLKHILQDCYQEKQ